MRALLRHPGLRAVALRVAVLLALAAAAVGIRAVGPGHADTTGWSVASVRGADVVILVLAVALLAAVVVTALASRGSMLAGAPRVRRRNPLPGLLFLLASVAIGVLLRRATQHRAASPAPAGHHPTPRPRPAAPGPMHSAVHTSVALLVVLALVAVGAGLVAALSRRSPPAAAAQDETEALSAGLSAAAEVLRRHRDDEAPRERVVLAYAAFEQALADRGVHRGASGTPTALLQRAVRAGVQPGAASDLTAVFSRARYGAEDIGESDVDIAERALDTLLARL